MALTRGSGCRGDVLRLVGAAQQGNYVRLCAMEAGGAGGAGLPLLLSRAATCQASAHTRLLGVISDGLLTCMLSPGTCPGCLVPTSPASDLEQSDPDPTAHLCDKVTRASHRTPHAPQRDGCSRSTCTAYESARITYVVDAVACSLVSLGSSCSGGRQTCACCCPSPACQGAQGRCS